MTKIQKENPVLLQARKQGRSTIVLSLTGFIEDRKFYLVQRQYDGSVIIKEADVQEKRNDNVAINEVEHRRLGDISAITENQMNISNKINDRK